MQNNESQRGKRDLGRIEKKDVTAALHTSLPIMVTFVVLGIGYGLLMQKHGFGPVWSLLSGIVIFSGTVQFVSVTMLSGGSFIMAAITALMVAARHIFFSISMIGRYSGEGKRKWYLFYALCDETYAMLSKDDGPEGVNTSAYRLMMTLFDQSAWVLGSFLGGWIGTLITFDSTGIDFAMTALFTTVFIQQWIQTRHDHHTGYGAHDPGNKDSSGPVISEEERRFLIIFCISAKWFRIQQWDFSLYTA